MNQPGGYYQRNRMGLLEIDTNITTDELKELGFVRMFEMEGHPTIWQLDIVDSYSHSKFIYMNHTLTYIKTSTIFHHNNNYYASPGYEVAREEHEVSTKTELLLLCDSLLKKYKFNIDTVDTINIKKS